MVGLDNTIVNVSLPSIHHDLHASLSGLQWTMDAYTLVIASLLLAAGSTADRIGRRRVFQAGLVLFSLGSLLCAMAPALGWLIGFRVLQAVGGSMLNPVAMSIIRNTFQDPRERAQAIGWWGSVAGLSFALGPIVGGALIAAADWRWVFLVNVPVAVVALALTARYIPESRARTPRRVDTVGQMLVMIILASCTYATIEGHTAGWGSAEILGLFAVALLATVVFVGYELRRREPLIDLRFFASVPFSGASVIAFCAFGAVAGVLFLETLYLQEARGFSGLRTGLYLLPLAVTGAIFAPVSGRVITNRGARLPLVAAGIALTAGAAMYTRLDSTTPPLSLLGAGLVFGIGFGLVQPPITDTAVAGMPAAQAGVASAIASTSRQVGNTFGVAITGAAAGRGVASTTGREFTDVNHTGWWVVTGFGVAVTAAGIITTTRWAQRTARRTAERIDTPTTASSAATATHAQSLAHDPPTEHAADRTR